MNKPIPDKLSEQIDRGVKEAVAEAIERHRRLGESISILKDDKVITLTADQIPPYLPNTPTPPILSQYEFPRRFPALPTEKPNPRDADGHS
jgi:hypothetical protein